MNDIVKKENRKALPRFLGMMLLARKAGGRKRWRTPRRPC